MGTRWRGLLAPIDKPTGDGRRMAKGAFRHRPLPLALKWQRSDEPGHDASVVIGTCDVLTIDEAAGEVWGEGELFDDQPTLPRLSEDVAEAMLLTRSKVIGPSVDAGAASVIFVRKGENDPLTDDDWDEIMWEAMDTGVDPEIEMLFVDYEIAAATLVTVPAFVEARPFELIPADSTAAAADVDVDASVGRARVLTAAAASAIIPADVFTAPDTAPDYQLLTVYPPRAGETFRRVAGFAAPFDTCHVGFKNVCYTAPETTTDYALYHRWPVNTDTGVMAAGRITTGHGRIGSGCDHVACRGNDDHACRDMTLVEAMAHYDRLRPIAHVRAFEYAGVGIWVQGVVAADADDRDLRVLGKQRVSGDWRDHGGQLEMVELLALAREKPGFPIPRVGLANGRQMSLTAASPPPRRILAGGGLPRAGAIARIGEALADSLIARGLITVAAPAPVPVELTAAAGDDPVVHTGAMVALRMTEGDAARLAVDGGEPADELHLTLMYLGEADAIDMATREEIVDALTTLVGEWQSTAAGVLHVAGDAFAASVFNAGTAETETALVVGLDGEQLSAIHDQVTVAVGQVFAAVPIQHEPWVAHVTLTYTDDLSLLADLAARTGQEIVFDRLRVAFGGDVVDIPLAAATDADAALVGEVEAALGLVDEGDRARQAAALLDQIGDVSHVRSV